MTYILGPCSAESREQVLETAREISEVRIQNSEFRFQKSEVRFIFRAGVWKPRTSPHSFQGVGAEGLKWLREVKERFGVDVATEVATPEHVQLALEAGIDYLWIGARTAANPMTVASLASQISDFRFQISDLKGVLIKNPVNEDAGLWLGNIERLEKTGVPVMAVHRGCGHRPCWAMAHKVRLARPDIPMLLDPSHMSGDAAQVPTLMRKIEELGLDGAMVEVHCDPKSALSDNAQQITPTQLGNIYDSILSRLCLASLISPSERQEELNWLRAEIDELDEQLWDTIAARMDVSRRIGEWKKAHDVAPLQPERYQQIVEQIKSRAESQESRDFMLRVWELIHAQSLKQQQ